GTWNVSRELVEINTPGNEGAPTVRGDGRQLIFTACDGLDGRYGRRTGEGSCDLFYADLDVLENQFEREMNLEAVNSKAWESQPSLSADGRWLFFVRAYRTQDGRVVQDIFQAERQADGAWSRPSRLPSSINTPGREENPVLHSDGKTLYFASNGHAGMGGLDLFVSRWQPDGSWSQAENLGFPINSSGDENSLQVFPDGRTALFATDREAPGNLDLWQFELPGFAAAASVALWRGEVLDADSQRPIRASVHVLDHLGNVVGTQSSSEIDGAFTLTFPATERVILQVEEEGYGFYSKAFEPTVGQEPFVSIELQRLEVGTVLVLRDVRFERSSAALDPSFQPDLEQLARTMQNAEFRIRIAGHTDGEGSAQRNQTLSEERALSVVRFLEAFGIDGSRMETIGYGMSQPIATNETEEGRALNRRTEIEIIQ
ncbi:MAG: OmpA family protein, partial [Flavobacteriales bacterium]